MAPFPQDLPPRPAPAQQSFKGRNCPEMRTCWSFDWATYSLSMSDKAHFYRAICMWIILAVRTAISAWTIAREFIWGHFAAGIVFSIISVIGFFFIAWCLAQIGGAMGYRKVMGMNIARWHLDVFLLVIAIIHVAILIGGFVGITQAGSSLSWLILWLAIFAVAWVLLAMGDGLVHDEFTTLYANGTPKESCRGHAASYNGKR